MLLTGPFFVNFRAILRMVTAPSRWEVMPRRWRRFLLPPMFICSWMAVISISATVMSPLAQVRPCICRGQKNWELAARSQVEIKICKATTRVAGISKASAWALPTGMLNG